MSSKIKPFKDINKHEVLSCIMMLAPRVGSMDFVRRGVTKAIKSLRSRSIGFLDNKESSEISPEFKALSVDAKEISITAATIVGYITETISDLNEYCIFSSIALPERGKTVTPYGVWTNNISTAVSRHYESCIEIRRHAKSAPRYRRSGSDYCEGMLVGICRVLLRPHMVKFARSLEERLGWPSVQKSGILDILTLSPRSARYVQ